MPEKENRKEALCVYSIDLTGLAVSHVVRNEYEAAMLREFISSLGLMSATLPIDVPSNYRRWYYPRPLRIEPSEN